MKIKQNGKLYLIGNFEMSAKQFKEAIHSKGGLGYGLEIANKFNLEPRALTEDDFIWTTEELHNILH